MEKYLCTKKCFYRGRVWAQGEILAPLSADEQVPHHFKKQSEVKPVAPAKDPRSFHEMQLAEAKADAEAVKAKAKATASKKQREEAAKDDFLA